MTSARSPLTSGCSRAALSPLHLTPGPERGLLVGYGRLPEPSIESAVAALAGAVRLAGRLEALGLLRRERTRGRKEVALYVTRAGRSRLRRGLEAREGAIRTLLEPLSAREREHLTALVGKVLGGRTRRRADAD